MSETVPVRDLWGRPLRNLRLSVTDRCNLRCHYCMPEEEYVVAAPRGPAHLRGDERARRRLRRARASTRFGSPAASRCCGGTCLASSRMLAAKPEIRDLAMTTNGVMLRRGGRRPARGRAPPGHGQPRHAAPRALPRPHPPRQPSAGAGGHRGGARRRVPRAQARHRGHARGERRRAGGSARVRTAGGGRGALHRVHGRGGGHRLVDGPGRLPRRDAGRRSARRYGPIEPIVEASSAPAERFRLPDGAVFGIIASTTQPFCRSCDRSRRDRGRHWYTCLYATRGMDLRDSAQVGRLAPRRWPP